MDKTTVIVICTNVIVIILTILGTTHASIDYLYWVR